MDIKLDSLNQIEEDYNAYVSYNTPLKRRAATTSYEGEQELYEHGIPNSPLVPIREFTIPVPDYLEFPLFSSSYF